MKWQQVLEHWKLGLKFGPFSGTYVPPPSEHEAAHRVISELEDRRVLIDPPYRSDVGPCVQSVEEIRRFLKKELKELSADAQLNLALQRLQSACRRFLSETQAHGMSRVSQASMLSSEQLTHFHIALGELRGAFGRDIADIAVQYERDVHDDLAVILPEILEDDS